jgi:hypothetical protein
MSVQEVNSFRPAETTQRDVTRLIVLCVSIHSMVAYMPVYVSAC